MFTFSFSPITAQNSWNHRKHLEQCIYRSPQWSEQNACKQCMHFSSVLPSTIYMTAVLLTLQKKNQTVIFELNSLDFQASNCHLTTVLSHTLPVLTFQTMKMMKTATHQANFLPDYFLRDLESQQ
jgi:hypothetical protein